MTSEEVTRQELADAITSRITITHVTLEQLLQRPLADSILAGLLDYARRISSGATIAAIAEHRGAGLLTARKLILIISANTDILSDAQLARIVVAGCRSNDSVDTFAALLVQIRMHVSYGELTARALSATLIRTRESSDIVGVLPLASIQHRLPNIEVTPPEPAAPQGSTNRLPKLGMH